MSDQLSAMLQNADDGLFDDLLVTVQNPNSDDQSAVAALFASPLGMEVLAVMRRAFVDVTIVEPGQPPEVHGIRQGQANVVFWIAGCVAAAKAEELSDE
jgi:hypothetical protein